MATLHSEDAAALRGALRDFGQVFAQMQRTMAESPYRAAPPSEADEEEEEPEAEEEGPTLRSLAKQQRELAKSLRKQSQQIDRLHHEQVDTLVFLGIWLVVLFCFGYIALKNALHRSTTSLLTLAPACHSTRRPHLLAPLPRPEVAHPLSAAHPFLQ